MCKPKKILYHWSSNGQQDRLGDLLCNCFHSKPYQRDRTQHLGHFWTNSVFDVKNHLDYVKTQENHISLYFVTTYYPIFTK